MRPLKALAWILLGAVLLGVPYRARTLDSEGYWQSHSLMDLIAPRLDGSWRAVIIKSILSYAPAWDTASLTGTQTITSVSTSNSCVQSTAGGDNSGASSGPSFNHAGYQITGPTTVTGHVGATNGGTTFTGGITVIEFYPGVLKSVQQAIPTDTGTSAVATISAVVVAKTWLCLGGFTTTEAANALFYSFQPQDATMTSTTQITWNHRNFLGATWNGYVTAMEFR